MARPTLRERLDADPDAAVAAVARAAGVSARAVIEALPEETRHFGEGGFFADAMKGMARWGDVRLVMETADGIREITGSVPEGRTARGAFNLSSRLGAHGLVRPERCGGIAFVERRVLGRDTASVVFLDGDGAIMFEVFVAPKPDGTLPRVQLAAFKALREAVVAEHIDD